MTNIIAKIEDIKKLSLGQPILPSFVDFHTSDACNMNCRGCAYKGRLTGEMMSRDDHFRAVDIFLKHGVKAFDFAGGGEPTMLPYLGELMAYIGKSGAHFGLITNGLYMADDVKEALLKYGTYVRYSLEVSGMGNYCRYKDCGHDTWETVINNIGEMVSRKKDEKSNLEVSLKYSIGKDQYILNSCTDPKTKISAGISMMYTEARIMGVDRLNIKRLVHEPCEIDPYEVDLPKLFDMAYKMEGPPAYVNLSPTPLEDVPYCWLSPVHTVMDHKGNIYICCYYYFRDNDFLIGNILENPFKKVWFSETHREKLKKIDRNSCAKVDCKFFAHHKAVEKFMDNGKGYFL